MKKLEPFELDTCGLDDNADRAACSLERRLESVVKIVNELVDAHNDTKDHDAPDVQGAWKYVSLERKLRRYEVALQSIARCEEVGEFAPARAAQAALSGYDVCLKVNGKFHIYRDGDVDNQVDEAMVQTTNK